MAEISDLDITDANNTARFPEGMQRSQINNSARALEGLLARWYEDTDGSITSSGSANAYAITSKRTISSLVNNTVMAWTANHTNTGAATLALNGLTAKSIKRADGGNVVAGDIVSGHPYVVVYKSSPDYWVLVSGVNSVPAAGLPAGTIVNRVYAETTTQTAVSATIPSDNSIPQSGEGTEIITASITPRASANRIRARFVAWGHMEIADSGIPAVALFRDAGADALHAVSVAYQNGSGSALDDRAAGYPLVLEFEHSPGTTSSTTYKIRVGGPITINKALYGGVSRATLVLEEIQA